MLPSVLLVSLVRTLTLLLHHLVQHLLMMVTGNCVRSPVRGQYLGWYWTGAEWVKFGLTDTGNINISGGSGGSMLLVILAKNGLGIDIQNTGTLNISNGATTLGSTLGHF